MLPLLGKRKLDNPGSVSPPSGAGLIMNEVAMSQDQLIQAAIYLTQTSYEAG